MMTLIVVAVIMIVVTIIMMVLIIVLVIMLTPVIATNIVLFDHLYCHSANSLSSIISMIII